MFYSGNQKSTIIQNGEMETVSKGVRPMENVEVSERDVAINLPK